MNQIASLLLQTLRVQMTDEEPSPELAAAYRSLSAEEWDALYRLAKQQDLAHLIGDFATRGALLPDGETAERFRKQSFFAVRRYHVSERELSRVGAVLSAQKIPYLPLKGAILRAEYPKPWMRTSCDLDILVPESELGAAVDALTHALNYTAAPMGTHDVGLNAPSGVHIELHYRLTEIEVADNLAQADKPLSSVFEKTLPMGDDEYHRILPREWFYYFHIYHMAKHFQNGGCGIRPFLDLFVMRKTPISTQKRDELLRAGGLLTFAQAAEKLASVWFDGEEADSLCKMMEDYLLSGGLYGNLDQQTKIQKLTSGGKFRYLLSRIFLPYDRLIFRYPALKGRRILLPFYQVRRWFELAFCGGAARTKRRFLTAVSDDPKEKEMKSMLTNLGILTENNGKQTDK